MNPPEQAVPPPPSASTASPPAGAGRTLLALVAPGALCLVLGLVAGRSDEIGMAVLIILVAVVGSLVAGIWAGIQFARRFAAGGGTNPFVAAGLALGCIVVSGVLSFGGCFAGLMSGARLQ